MAFLFTKFFEKLNSGEKMSKFLRMKQKMKKNAKKLNEKPKTHAKNSELKQKTQGPRGIPLALPQITAVFSAQVERGC